MSANIPSAPGIERQSLVDELCDEQCRRWNAGDYVTVESLLEQSPASILPPELLTELVYNEYRLREDFGPPPDRDEFFRRFPEITDQLARQLAFHSGVEGSDLDPEPDGEPDDDGQEVFRRLLDQESLAGLRMGNYVIGPLLGSGAFGAVYRAENVYLKNTVALKFPAGSEIAKGRRQRHLKEAEFACRLDHEHIVRLREVHKACHFFCLIYDYCPGPTLDRWMQ